MEKTSLLFTQLNYNLKTQVFTKKRNYYLHRRLSRVNEVKGTFTNKSKLNTFGFPFIPVNGILPDQRQPQSSNL